MQTNHPQNTSLSLIQKIKSFFNDKGINQNGDEDEDVVVNEASFSIPMSQRGKMRDQFKKQNQTMPSIVTKKQFSIDDDDNMYESHSPKEIKKIDIQPQQQEIKIIQQPQYVMTQNADGYEEIFIKTLNSPRLIEKDPQKEPYQKGQIINFPLTSTFRVSKVPNIFETLVDYIYGSVSRDIVFDGGWIYVLKNQGKDKFKVCSCTSLKRLFKVLIKKNDRKPPLKLAFVNKQNNVHSMPQIKEFTLMNKSQIDLFFTKLRGEVQKHGLDIQFKR